MNNAGILSGPKAIAGYKLASLSFEFKRRTLSRESIKRRGDPQKLNEETAETTQQTEGDRTLRR